MTTYLTNYVSTDAVFTASIIFNSAPDYIEMCMSRIEILYILELLSNYSSNSQLEVENTNNYSFSRSNIARLRSVIFLGFNIYGSH